MNEVRLDIELNDFDFECIDEFEHEHWILYELDIVMNEFEHEPCMNMLEMEWKWMNILTWINGHDLDLHEWWTWLEQDYDLNESIIMNQRP